MSLNKISILETIYLIKESLGEENMFIQSTTIKNFNAHAKKISKYTAGKVLPQPVYTDINVYYGCQNVMVRYVLAKPAKQEFNENVDLIKYEDESRIKMFDNTFANISEKDTVHIFIPVSKIKELQAVLSPALILHHKSGNGAAYEANLDINKYGIMATCYNDNGSAFRGYVPLQEKRNDTTEEKIQSIVLNAKYLTDLLTMFAKETHDAIELYIAPYNENHYDNGHCIVPIMIKAGQVEAIITAIQINDEFNECLENVNNIL